MDEVRHISPTISAGSFDGEAAFDAEYYIRHYAHDIKDKNIIEHYRQIGEKSGFKPNFIFDPRWYCSQYGLRMDSELLVNYMQEGEKAGRKPSALFDTAWFIDTYRDHLQNVENVSAIVFYVQNRSELKLSPNPYFDLEYYYEQNPDVASASVDGFEHYVTWGVFEGRRASKNFDADFVWYRYLANNKSINPFLAFLDYGIGLGWSAIPIADTHSVAREIKINQAPSISFEGEQASYGGLKKAKSFAFYLPQFHAIPENDEWWGKGFTEWTNVPRGVPRFKGHVQPKIPRDLGFYDLMSSDTINKQIDMARRGGIYGFCFYYYNFDGKRLLEKPLDKFLELSESRFPFCLMWANENWTRRWDGREQDILLAQTYNNADEQSLIADISMYLKQPSYYRISGRPLFLLYRADVIPNCRQTLKRWRKIFLDEHGLNPIIAMAQAFGTNDPTIYGFDAAIEFPPHKFGSFLRRANADFEILDHDFQGDIRLYDDLVKESLGDFPKAYPLIKTIVPGWDNDARKQGAGLTFQGSTPEKFENWIKGLVAKLDDNRIFSEKLFFVNAWNEWCEGAYLEPDTHYGFAYVNSFARAISGSRDFSKRKILLVGHDAFPAGAQQLIYNIGSTLRFRFGIEVSFILMGGGGMVKDYSDVGPTYVVDQHMNFWPELNGHIHRLAEAGYSHAVTNSVFSGSIIDSLRGDNFSVVSLIHELPKIIESSAGRGYVTNIFEKSHTVVFPNEYVWRELTTKYGHPSGRTVVRPQGIYKSLQHHDRDEVRASLQIPEGAKIVLNVGYADLRKGVDIFASAANFMKSAGDDIYFIWIGGRDPSIDTWLNYKSENSNLLFLGFTREVDKFICAADVFLLSSREDPFPSVVLESLALGVPVVAFEGTGGASELLRDERLGAIVPYNDLAALAEKIRSTINSDDVSGRRRLSDYRRKFAERQFDFSEYCADVISMTQDFKRVSVIVPNYNYASYIAERLESIFAQTYPIYEIIVLDDASSDNSVNVIEMLATQNRREFTLVENDTNSGNVFVQWQKGLRLARGEYVWIAEADDLSDPLFLECLVEAVAKSHALFGFCDSRAVDDIGNTIYDNYKGYYNTLLPGALSEPELFDADDFLSRYLSTRNMILNASSVLWSRAALVEALGDLEEQEIAELRLAGDWKTYIRACLSGGKVAYEPAVLNVHRRHARSVTGSIEKHLHIREIESVHAFFNEQTGSLDALDEQKIYIQTLRSQLS